MKLCMLLTMMLFIGFNALADETPVADEIQSPEFMYKFTIEVCGFKNLKAVKKATKQQSADCDKQYLETFNAKLIQAYPHANWSETHIWCQANPFECPKDYKKLESHIRESNDTAVAAEKEREESREQYLANQQQQARDNADHIARAQLAAAMLARPSVQPTQLQIPLRCTANRVGNYTYTNCN